MGPEELIQRGEQAYGRLYRGRLRETLETTAWGKFLIVNVETGEYLVAGSREEALARFRARFPGAASYVARIGILPLIA